MITVSSEKLEALTCRWFITLVMLVSMLGACDSDTGMTKRKDAGEVPTDVQGPDTAVTDTSVPKGDAPSTPDTTSDGAMTPDNGPNPWADVEWGKDEGPTQNDVVAPGDVGASDDVSTPGKPEKPIPEGKGACDNQSDIDLLFALDDINAVMMKCALDCLGDEACSTECVIKASGVSEPCGSCFGDTIGCTLKNCMFNCLEPESENCMTCQKTHCTDSFEECAGITPPE